MRAQTRDRPSRLDRLETRSVENSFESWRITWIRDTVRRRSWRKNRGGIELSPASLKRDEISCISRWKISQRLGFQIKILLNILRIIPRELLFMPWSMYVRLPAKREPISLVQYWQWDLIKTTAWFLVLTAWSRYRSSMPDSALTAVRKYRRRFKLS